MPELAPYDPTDGPLVWTAPWPTDAPDCGYPVLPDVEVIRLLAEQTGQMNHHPILQRLGGRFYLMHTHHALNHHESSQGRNCLAWVSDESGATWTGPLEILPPPDAVTPAVIRNLPDDSRHPLGFPLRFVLASDGQVYGLSRLGYKHWGETGEMRDSASHHTIGTVARRVDADGGMGELFWIHRDEIWPDHPHMRYADRSDSALGRELWAASGYWTPEGRGMSPTRVRFPGPWRQDAPDGIQIAEYSTLPLGDGRALALGRSGNQNDVHRHYLAESPDMGETWGPFRRTNIPTKNWSTLGQLPDGRLYIVGSLADRQQHLRQPLAIATSRDGVHFDCVWQVFDDRIHAVRHAEIHDGYIWVGICHGGAKNAGRQDVAVIKIPVAALDQQVSP